MKYIIILIVFWGLLHQTCFGQTDYPEIGKIMPDHLFTNIVQFSKSKASISEFRGKWLILDLWSIYCGACLQAMPKMSNIQEKFKDRVQVLMVGTIDVRGRVLDTNGNPVNNNDDVIIGKTKRTWNYMRNLYNLKTANAFDNSLFTKLQGNGRLGLPTIICIDPEGIVRWITHSIDEKNIEDLISGNIPKGELKYLPLSVSQKTNRATTFDLSNGIIEAKDTTLLYRSLITNYTSDIGAHPIDFYNQMLHMPVNKNAPIQLCGKLADLYYFAFTGKLDLLTQPKMEIGGENYLQYPILEIKDSSLFYDIRNEDRQMENSKNIFCYSLSVPRDRYVDQSALRKIMQTDLKNYFKYDVVIEKRMVPVKYLVIRDKVKAEKLRTKGKYKTMRKVTLKDGRDYISVEEPKELSRYLIDDMKDYPFSGLIEKFGHCLPKLPQYNYPALKEYVIPIVDKTGITYNIDMLLKADTNSYDDMLKAINEHGLDLISGLIEANVLVIRDPKN